MHDGEGVDSVADVELKEHLYDVVKNGDGRLDFDDLLQQFHALNLGLEIGKRLKLPR